MIKRDLFVEIIVAWQSSNFDVEATAKFSELCMRGFSEVVEIQTGKLLEMQIHSSLSRNEVAIQVEEMSRTFLANPVTESFRFTIHRPEDFIDLEDALERIFLPDRRDILEGLVRNVLEHIHPRYLSHTGNSIKNTFMVDLKGWVFQCRICNERSFLSKCLGELKGLPWTHDQLMFWLRDMAVWLKPHLLLFFYPHLSARYSEEELLQATAYGDAMREEKKKLN